MKEKILISTIVRNRGNILYNYFNQINSFIDSLKNNYSFSISIYENDSVDQSKHILTNNNYDNFENYYLKCENINTYYYGSVKDNQRVINFANARNKTIENVNLNDYNWLLIIEPDIVYNNSTIERIITRSDLNFTPDIYSGVLMMNNIPYDRWGMRRTIDDDWGWFMDDYKLNPIREFWTTANGVCLYNMEPFKKGLKFSAYNKRINKYDCDTAVLCEDFRNMGYNKIYVNQSILPEHAH